MSCRPLNNDGVLPMTTTQAPHFSQFANLQQVAPCAPKSKRGDRIWSIRQTLDEVDRKPSASRHVERPLPPAWLIGSRSTVEASAKQWHCKARRRDGCRLQKNSPAMACAVISFPDERRGDWVPYRDDALRYFSKTYGRRLAGAVEHLDEKHPHLHIYLVPLEGEPFGAVHPGYGASRKARGAPGNLVGSAYRTAMAAWQDSLFNAFGDKHGLTRYGSKRKRLERSEALAQRELAERAQRLKEKEDAAAAAFEEAARMKRALREERAAMQERHVQLNRFAEAIQLREQRLKEEPLSRLEARNAELEAELAARAKELDEVRFRNRMLEERIATTQSTMTSMRTLPKPSPR